MHLDIAKFQQWISKHKQEIALLQSQRCQCLLQILLLTKVFRLSVSSIVYIYSFIKKEAIEISDILELRPLKLTSKFIYGEEMLSLKINVLKNLSSKDDC